MSTNGLSSKATLVNLSIGDWSGFKFDKKATEKLCQEQNAANNAARINKTLIDREEIKAYQKIRNEARTRHYFLTLPWMDNGYRILPSQIIIDYKIEFKQFEDKFMEVVKEFISRYPQMIEYSKRILGSLYKQEDFPLVYEVAKKFKFKVDYLPVPEVNDFRIDIEQQIKSELEEELKDRLICNNNAIIKDSIERYKTSVEHMIVKLSEYKGKGEGKAGSFRDSLVNNLKDLSEIMPKLNIFNDPDIDKITDMVKAELINYNCDELRENETLRSNINNKAKEILNTIDKKYEEFL